MPARHFLSQQVLPKSLNDEQMVSCQVQNLYLTKIECIMLRITSDKVNRALDNVHFDE